MKLKSANDRVHLHSAENKFEKLRDYNNFSYCISVRESTIFFLEALVDDVSFFPLLTMEYNAIFGE